MAHQAAAAMTMSYEVSPHVGVGPFRFGMTADEARGVAGPPKRSLKTPSRELKLNYEGFQLLFSDAKGLVEATFTSEVCLIVGGADLFRHAAPLRHLASLDPSPLESVGILYFPKLGNTLSGFHDEDARTATVMCRGRLDDLLPKFKPFRIAKG
jgi:hypothetical protein